MTATPSPSTMPGFRDRSTRLALLDAFQVFLGACCGLMAAMVAVSSILAAAQAQVTDTRSVAPAAVFYVLLAAAFIWLGSASTLARR